MTRTRLSFVALVALLLLTGATWRLADASASPTALAVVSGLKVMVILWVFLELDRSLPAWTLIGAGISAGILGGAVLAMGG